MVLPVLRECINNLDFSLFYVTIWTYFIDSDLLPSFTLHCAIILTLKYEPVNCSILTVVDYSVSRDAPTVDCTVFDLDRRSAITFRHPGMCLPLRFMMAPGHDLRHESAHLC